MTDVKDGFYRAVLLYRNSTFLEAVTVIDNFIFVVILLCVPYQINEIVTSLWWTERDTCILALTHVHQRSNSFIFDIYCHFLVLSGMQNCCIDLVAMTLLH